MMRAAKIVENMHACIRDRVEAGMRKNDLIADIFMRALQAPTSSVATIRPSSARAFWRGCDRGSPYLG